MVVSVLGKNVNKIKKQWPCDVMLVSEEQSSNAYPPMLVRSLGSIMFVRLEQPENVHHSIQVILLGITIPVIEVPWNVGW